MFDKTTRDYLITKQVKQGKLTISSSFEPLANWINKCFKAKVLNICYDEIESRKILTIIFEFLKEELKFRCGGRLEISTVKNKN